MGDSEERADEIEVLQSIYSEEFAWVEEPSKFSILLAPTSEDGEEVHVTASLVVLHPENYPSASIPQFEVHVVKGLSTKQADEMLALATTTAEEGLGAPSVFSACEALKEWLADNNVPGQDDSMYAQMMRREQQKGLEAIKSSKRAELSKAADNEGKGESIDPEELARIRKRQEQGTVTADTFEEWRVQFETEMREKARADVAAGLTLNRMQIALLGLDVVQAPSGKEIWTKRLSKGYTGDDDGDETTGDLTGSVDAATAAAEDEIYAQYAARKARAGVEGSDDDDDDDNSYSGSEDEADDDDDYDEDGGDDSDGDGDYVPKGLSNGTVFTGSKPQTRSASASASIQDRFDRLKVGGTR